MKLRYRNPDSDPRGPWQSVSLNVQDGHATKGQFYEIVGPSGRVHHPPKGRCWVYTKPKMLKEVASGNIWFGKNGGGVPRRKKFLSNSTLLAAPETLWRASEVGTTLEAKREVLQLFPEKAVFDTPKPERLLERIIKISTDPGELVLDPYLGTGTTAAVASRIGRRYLGIESGEAAFDLAVERLKISAALSNERIRAVRFPYKLGL